MAAVVVSLGACAPATAPEVPAAGPGGRPDPALVAGREIYTRRCAACHGTAGGGGRGPALDGDRLIERYPDPADQVRVVAEGRGGMPAFEGVLDPEELEAVVRYTREVLGAG
jgi:mono/diheme cytochrome c family protein